MSLQEPPDNGNTPENEETPREDPSPDDDQLEKEKSEPASENLKDESEHTGETLVSGDDPDLKMREIEALLSLEMKSQRSSPAGRHSGCFTCLLVGLVIVMIGTIALAGKLLGFFNNNLISDFSPVSIPISITPGEKEDLERQLKDYEASLLKSSETGEIMDFSLKLTENQANFLLASVDERIINNRSLRILRVYTSGGQTRILQASCLDSHRFINTIIHGEPSVRDGVFSMNIRKIQAGKVENAEFMKSRAIERMEKLLVEIPVSLQLPFRIRDLKIENELIHTTIRIIPGGR